MLTDAQLQLLKEIHSGHTGIDEGQAQVLLEQGLIARHQGGFGVTPQGRHALGLGEGFGDAIVDAVLPGAGAQQAEEKH
jgi:hypothetical protein